LFDQVQSPLLVGCYHEKRFVTTFNNRQFQKEHFGHLVFWEKFGCQG
jgi:hypothetical protein